jgi:hypothetical protein
MVLRLHGGEDTDAYTVTPIGLRRLAFGIHRAVFSESDQLKESNAALRSPTQSLANADNLRGVPLAAR